MLRRGAGAGLVLAVWATVAAAAQTPQPFPRPGEPRPTGVPSRGRPPGPAVCDRQRADTCRRTIGARCRPGGPLRRPAIRTPRAPRKWSSRCTRRRSSSRRTTPDAGSAICSTARRPASRRSSRYYRMQLGDKGDLVFKEPPTHVFEVGRFREETMAFPPGVTVKDWASGGSQGYPNPEAGRATRALRDDHHDRAAAAGRRGAGALGHPQSRAAR